MNKDDINQAVADWVDEFEEEMRIETIGDEAHLALFKLANELEANDAKKYEVIIKRCRTGYYHDFATKVAFPKMEMHRDLLEADLIEVDRRMQDGEFDS